MKIRKARIEESQAGHNDSYSIGRYFYCIREEVSMEVKRQLNAAVLWKTIKSYLKVFFFILLNVSGDRPR